MAARIQGKFGGWWNSSTRRLSRQFFSWSIFRAHIQETWGFLGDSRTGRFVGDRAGRPAEQISQEAQIRTLLDKQKRANSCRVPGRNQQTRISSRLWQKKFTNIGWNCWISTRRTSLRSSWRSSTERSTTCSRTVTAAKFGITRSSPESLTEMEELKTFQSSTFDTIARRRLIEDQDTILELSGRIQELQNEINYEWFKRVSGCWIYSQWKFPRYQSTSVIPTASNSWRNAKPFFWSAEPQRRAAKHLGHTWISGNVFLEIQMRHHQHLILKNWINGVHRSRSRFIHPQWKRVKGKNKTKIRDASLDRQPKIQSSLVSEILQRIMGQTKNHCRFRIFILTNSLHQPRLLAGRKHSRLRYVLVHNFLRKRCNGSKKWRWLFQWMIWNLRCL